MKKNGKSASFTNSDPVMIKTYIALFRSFNVEPKNLKAILHLHSYHDKYKQAMFWSKVTGIPKKNISIYNKVNSGKIVRKNYPGCISIRLYNVKILHELRSYYQLYAKRYGGLVQW